MSRAPFRMERRAEPPPAVARTSESNQVAKETKDLSPPSVDAAAAPPTNEPEDNVAPCEVKSAVIEPSKEAIQAAISACQSLQELPGSFMGWGERSERTLRAALALLPLMKSDAVRRQVMDTLKKQRQRAPNAKSTEALLAVQLCVPPKDKAVQKECSRFANVVLVAADENVTQDGVPAWLKNTTLTEVLHKAAGLKQKPSSKTYSFAITKRHEWIWRRFEANDTSIRDQLTGALNLLNAGLKKEAEEQAKVEPPATVFGGVMTDAASSSAAAQEVPVDA